MRCHLFQHVPFEGLGSIGPWLAARDVRVTSTRFFEERPQLPAADAFDLLVVMGGPMSVNDETRLPWLRDERRLVAEAVAGGKAVLGICLGAQLIARALGARVFPNAQKEIGWFPVFGERDATDPLAFPHAFTAFHWHGETFDLPPGAVRLAHSAACANQAFRFGERVVGLQFHLETTPASADALIDHCRDELVPGPFVQTEAELRAAGAARYAEVNARMAALLAALLSRLSSAAGSTKLFNK
jgi:GMP synthase-like glutamine amidotransferase